MSITKVPKERYEKAFLEYHPRFLETDYEFIERSDNFASDGVVNYDNSDGKTRFPAILATLLGCQGTDGSRAVVPAALNLGVTSVEVKEIVYQAMAYLSVGRVFPFLKAANGALIVQGVEPPLPGQATVATENRLEAGERAQMDTMGEGMKNFWKSGPEENRHISTWLTDNCFDDYCTRTGLTYQQREITIFCFLLVQGGCEPQLIFHTGADMRIGNDKAFLIKIISQCISYLGYPRSLNALRYVNEMAKKT